MFNFIFITNNVTNIKILLNNYLTSLFYMGIGVSDMYCTIALAFYSQHGKERFRKKKMKKVQKTLVIDVFIMYHIISYVNKK